MGQPLTSAEARTAAALARALGPTDLTLLAEAASGYADQLELTNRHYPQLPGAAGIATAAVRLRALEGLLRDSCDEQYHVADDKPAINRRVVVTYRLFVGGEPEKFEGVIREMRPANQGPNPSRPGARFRIEPRYEGLSKLAGWYSDQEFEVISP